MPFPSGIKFHHLKSGKLIATSLVKHWNVPHPKHAFGRYNIPRKKVKRKVLHKGWLLGKTKWQQKKDWEEKKKPCRPLKSQQVHCLRVSKPKSDNTLECHLSKSGKQTRWYFILLNSIFITHWDHDRFHLKRIYIIWKRLHEKQSTRISVNSSFRSVNGLPNDSAEKRSEWNQIKNLVKK